MHTVSLIAAPAAANLESALLDGLAASPPPGLAVR